jgi:hypothetical protein
MIKYKKFCRTNHVTFFSCYKTKFNKENAGDVKIFIELHKKTKELLHSYEDKLDKGGSVNEKLYIDITRGILLSELSAENKVHMIDYYELENFVPEYLNNILINARMKLCKDYEEEQKLKTHKKVESVNITCNVCNPQTKCLIQ